MNAAIYARVSSAQQKQEHTIASHTAALTAFAEEGRVPPETHRILAIEAAEAGVSLNRLISSKLS